LSLPDPIVDDLLKKYLLHAHRAVIVSFLDLLNIPHSEGMIEENFDYLTGWRKGEITSLEWADVEGDVVRLKGINAKNGEGRQVVLNGPLAELIERRKAARHVEKDGTVMLSTFIFHLDGEPVGDFRKAWATACVEARLGQFICKKCDQPVNGHTCEQCNAETRYEGRLFHDLRRTAVRNMVRACVPEKVAMTISGHKTRSIFDRYNIVNESDLREAMQLTQTYLDVNRKEPKITAAMRQAEREESAPDPKGRTIAGHYSDLCKKTA
jgi:integrase